MQEFVLNIPSQLQKVKSQKCEVIIVLGNESCDLDSAVSALVYAHYLSASSPSKVVIPLLNVAREELPLKTEVIYCLEKKLGLRVSDLACRDELNFEDLGEFKLVLVDHHALTGKDIPYEIKVIEIIDHHPTENPISLQNCRLELVGSCSTLVLQKIWASKPEYADSTALNLVRWTILVDTVNLSKEAKKVTQLDIDVLKKIEHIIHASSSDRSDLFAEITRVKNDISSLSVGQLLVKDLKIISISNDISIGMSSVMMSTIEMSKKENFIRDLNTFLKTKNCSFAFIMGAVLEPESGNLTRDILIYPVSSADKVAAAWILANQLPQCSYLKLLKLQDDISLKDVAIFSQSDPSFSRKKILPIIREIFHQHS